MLETEGISAAQTSVNRSFDMRYVGQEYFINVPLPSGVALEQLDNLELKALFDEKYERTYGHKNLAESVELVNLRVEARGALDALDEADEPKVEATSDDHVDDPVTHAVVFSGTSVGTRFLQRTHLSKQTDKRYDGPLVIEELSCTSVVPPGFSLRVDEHGNLVIEPKEATQ